MWSNGGLSYIASAVGKPIRFEKATATRARLTYAAVCVEIKPDRELPASIKLDIGRPAEDYEEIVVHYPWRPLMCQDCCLFGH